MLYVVILCGLLSIAYAAAGRRSRCWLRTREMRACARSRQRSARALRPISPPVHDDRDRRRRRFPDHWWLLSGTAAVGFLIGAVLSASQASSACTCRSARTCARAGRFGEPRRGLDIAFKAGAITGLLVAGLALLGVSVYYWVLTGPMGLASNDRTVIDALVALGFGASLISIFARLGGGIFTKGADVGGDLVGKVEAGIPEDDPRNPATIADNVGDNVGDCAGMAADLFETYAVTVVATMVLGAIFFGGTDILNSVMLYPLAICGACIITSIVGTFFVKLGTNGSIMGALYKGLIVTGLLSVVGLGAATSLTIGWGEIGTGGGVVITGTNLFICGLLGLLVTGLIVVITEYYTGTNKRPVNSIAQASVTGHGTNVIQGLAVSLESTALPAIVIVGGIISTFQLAGLFGTAIAVTTMLGLAGMIVALDAFGPVTDNAGGIAEMSGLPKEVRQSTDALDAVGNTTKAVTKGYAIGSAVSARWCSSRPTATTSNTSRPIRRSTRTSPTWAPCRFRSPTPMWSPA